MIAQSETFVNRFLHSFGKALPGKHRRRITVDFLSRRKFPTLFLK